MALNDIGTSIFDNYGTSKGTLLSINDIGTSKFDSYGNASGFIGTEERRTPLRTLMGIGI